MEEPIYLEGCWVCGLAEVILPPAELKPSLVVRPPASTPRQHATNQPTADPAAAASESEQEGEAGESSENTQGGSPAEPARGSSEQEEEETEGSTAGAASQHPAGGSVVSNELSAVVLNPAADPQGTNQHIVVKISQGATATLDQILEETYNSSAGDTGEADGILVALEQLDVPAYLNNTADPITEVTAHLKLPSSQESIEYAFEEGSTPQSFVENLASYARSREEAMDWINDARNTWKRLLRQPNAGLKKRVRRGAAELAVRNDVDGERIFIYCDIVENAPCSDVKTRCLRIISASRENRHFILFPVYYLNCSQKVLQFLHVEMKDKRGELINFLPSKHPNVIILHFRRVY